MKYTDLRIVSYRTTYETEHITCFEEAKLVAVCGNETVVGVAPQLYIERYPGAIHNVVQKTSEHHCRTSLLSGVYCAICRKELV